MSKKNKHFANHIPSEELSQPDHNLAGEIKNRLHEEMQASAMDINLFCRNGHVHLSGIVDLYAEKKTAESIIKQIDGVKSIENKITIAMDSNITDKHIEKEVTDKLLHQEKDSVKGVGIKVNDGVVSLIGSVNTLKEVDLAMKAAAENRGVKDVVNNLSIASSGEFTDTAISDKIIQELSQTNLSFRDVHREVSGGVVSLFGYLDNQQEVELAKEITMGIEGVKKVINHIKVRDNK
ncbi:BON domain-containing protein [Alkaliphilus peptidifermentans]|uniref:Osmotically-inducible protein OsmY, contains BON domain n=1 Tax=Alkaliphilus peptidifermentans DSM 18978 TaxID=1120976 RepID=A0A1G5KS71_9FIRM|nr:BON domain-containing protein [Alkaliphilus peptidifermentans]SCZ02789.1 Osmotically-inducible protein OsmY, contains BON domain [Alkaliphilus peptidifermentans DSM 18978]